MSLLAGFDMVIEIARAKLLEYIQTATLAGQSLTHPRSAHPCSAQYERGAESDFLSVTVKGVDP